MTWSGDYATAQARADEAGAKVKLGYLGVGEQWN